MKKIVEEFKKHLAEGKQTEEEVRIFIQNLKSDNMKKHVQQGKPTLYVETDHNITEEFADSVYKETDKYSITPTSFKERIFANDFTESVDTNTLRATKKVTTALEHVQEHIQAIKTPYEKDVQMGIMSDAKMKEILSQKSDYIFYNNRLDELSQFVEHLNAYDDLKLSEFCYYKDTYSNASNNSVIRYGLNASKLSELARQHNKLFKSDKGPSQKSNKSNKDILPKTVLNPLEVFLLEKAVQSVASKNAVLADIFARNEKDEIQFDKKTTFPETHTVVLYKNSEADVVVIDPSNSTFSKYLASEISNLLINGALLNTTLKPPNNEIKIYTPDKNVGTGPEKDQYRDCIDIATKIAFGLNKDGVDIDAKKIDALPIVKAISNSSIINEDFLKEYGVTRIRQSSDDKIRELSGKLISKARQQVKSLTSYENAEIENDIAQKNIKVFSHNYKPDEYSQGLSVFSALIQSNNQDITDFTKQDVSALGQLVKEFSNQVEIHQE